MKNTLPNKIHDFLFVKFHTIGIIVF